MMLIFAFSRGCFIKGYWRRSLPAGIRISLAVLSFVLIGFWLEEQYQGENNASKL